jgi:hypothetical protein
MRLCNPWTSGDEAGVGVLPVSWEGSLPWLDGWRNDLSAMRTTHPSRAGQGPLTLGGFCVCLQEVVVCLTLVSRKP